MFNKATFFFFQVTMAGDFILAVASMMIARLRNDDVTLTLSQVCYRKTCFIVILTYRFECFDSSRRSIDFLRCIYTTQ